MAAYSYLRESADWMPRLVSLRDSDVGNLVITDVDLRGASSLVRGGSTSSASRAGVR